MDREEKKEKDDKVVGFLQNQVNVFLTVISLLLALNLGFAMKISSTQTDDGKELVRLKTIQDINVADVGVLKLNQGLLKADQISLKLEWVNALKDWTDDNYVRKPQK